MVVEAVAAATAFNKVNPHQIQLLFAYDNLHFCDAFRAESNFVSNPGKPSNFEKGSL